MTLAFLLLSYSIACPKVSSQSTSLTISGQYGSFLQLTAGTPPSTGGRNVEISSGNTGALAAGGTADMENFGASVNFGDLSKGDGNPVTSGVGLRMRSNTECQLVTSLSSFQATNLRYQGRDVTLADGGSFVKVWAGPITATGNNALNPGEATINSFFTSGSTLSTISRGQASGSSTLVCAMPAASTGGFGNSVDNALEIPFFVSVPTGFDLGPAPGAAEGTFSFVLQFGLFGGP